MFWIFLLQLISTFQGFSAEHETLCSSNACFTLHMDRVSFQKARQNCEDNGGYLMTVRDGGEEDVLHSLLTQIHGKHQDRALRFWIGLKLHRGDCVSAQKTLRGFKWVSGEEDSQYNNWEREPVTTCTEERCVKVHYNSQRQLKWTAEPCKKPAFYACKFYFKGMCRPLALLGPGEITYTVPFSKHPERSEMQSFPFGTYASVLCAGDEYLEYSVCTTMDDTYRWNRPGPFCQTGKRSCDVNNGGCEHECQQEAEEVRCSCKEGYDLGEDGLGCRRKDLCGVDTCEHQCVTRESGFSCTCPDGFRLEANQRNCSDVDECRSHACGNQLCVNTPGSYTCACKDGYEMVDGTCSDVDECKRGRRCEHGCSNSIGSFSCSCDEGFALSRDGHTCVDIDECVNYPCHDKCINTAGSFFCTCPQGFLMESDGSTCAPDVTETSADSSDEPAAASTDEPAAASPEQPAAASPGDPAAASPGEPAAASPEQPAAASPGEPAAASPGEPAAASPEQPAAASPGEPAAASPGEPAAASPEQPAAASPGEPAAASPGEPAAASPEQPAAASPEQPAAASPEQPAAASPEQPAASSSDEPPEEETPENVTEPLTRSLVELQHPSPHTDAPPSDLVNVTDGEQQQSTNASFVAGFAQSVNSRVIICVVGSVVPLLLLIAVTLAIAIVRCNRSKKEAKKTTTTDGYCWVSSGLDPRLEKLYESILTDDL